jgi:ribosomal protein L23
LQSIYNVTPVSVRLITVPMKWRARRAMVRRSFKKAIVRLKDGEKIELAG